MAPGGGSDLWHWHGFQQCQELQASTQTLAPQGPWAQTWLSAASLAWMTPWSQVTVLATQTGMAPVVAQPLNTNMVTSWGLDMGYWTSTQTPTVVGPQDDEF